MPYPPTLVAAAGGGGVKQYASYYPYGLRITASTVALSGGSSTNEDLYNGKELTGAFGLGWYHYGARFYDVAIARWTTMDPADEFNSPYVYVGGDPVNLVDPDGRQAAASPDLKAECPECVNLREGVTVTASRNFNTGAFSVEGTLYYNPALEQGRRAAFQAMRNNAALARAMLEDAQAGITTRSLAMRAHIHNGQSTTLAYSAVIGSDIAGTASMFTGIGSVAGAGLLYFRRGALKYTTRQVFIRGSQGLASASTSSGAADLTIQTGLVAAGRGQVSDLIAPSVGTLLGLGSGSRLFHGLSVTSHPGASFRLGGRFVDNASGFSIFLGSSALGGSGALYQLGNEISQ